MASREDDDIPYDSDSDSDENDPIIRELRTEMVRLEAHIDQLMAATREQNEELVQLQTRLTELEELVEQLRQRFHRSTRTWAWIAGCYGAALGMWLSWLLRQF